MFRSSYISLFFTFSPTFFSSTSCVGVVKKWNGLKGFGFIEDMSSKTELFVHREDFVSVCSNKNLRPGSRLLFDKENSSRSGGGRSTNRGRPSPGQRERAINVRQLDAGPVRLGAAAAAAADVVASQDAAETLRSSSSRSSASSLTSLAVDANDSCSSLQEKFSSSASSSSSSSSSTTSSSTLQHAAASALVNQRGLGGTVVSWDDEAGFGYIQVDAASTRQPCRIFCHRSGVISATSCGVSVGSSAAGSAARFSLAGGTSGSTFSTSIPILRNHSRRSSSSSQNKILSSLMNLHGGERMRSGAGGNNSQSLCSPSLACGERVIFDVQVDNRLGPNRGKIIAANVRTEIVP